MLGVMREIFYCKKCFSTNKKLKKLIYLEKRYGEDYFCCNRCSENYREFNCLTITDILQWVVDKCQQPKS